MSISLDTGQVIKKTAVIVDPQSGYNASDEFIPGSTYQVKRISDGSVVFLGNPVIWNEGNTSSQSGDRGWWFDFSSVRDTGSYFVYDLEKNVRSYSFTIDSLVYRDMLKADRL